MYEVLCMEMFIEMSFSVLSHLHTIEEMFSNYMTSQAFLRYYQELVIKNSFYISTAAKSLFNKAGN